MKVVTLFLFSILLFGCKKGEDEVIIVPRNYTGYIVIIYNQKDGAAPQYKDGKRVYNMPENGILKTQFSIDTDWINLPEFYYEKITVENKIPFKLEPKNLPVDTVVASGGTSGGVNKDLAGKEVVRFITYYIGNKSQTDAAYERAEKLDIIKLSK